ncbi:putative mitochondrial carrier domain-containing protein [Medicago truncatula]|uniref:Putative mitochondrial carrier domain-containing protein n=1 Tax=Medicago truncatula TaxID=3880 RepID=A0A396GT05_MEDTR|nr:putative mitochondrial carrier domain-containing protein [Medicago truncatula]
MFCFIFTIEICLLTLSDALFFILFALQGTIFVATFPAAVCCLPFEYVMIEIKKMQPDDKGKYPYTGYVDCAVKTLIAGGPLKFYTGFSVYCARIFPCVTLYILLMADAMYLLQPI